MSENGQKMAKNVFPPPSGGRRTRKLVEIHNKLQVKTVKCIKGLNHKVEQHFPAILAAILIYNLQTSCEG